MSSTAATAARVLGSDKVLAIAHADAVKVYRDLSGYRIQLVLEPDGCRPERHPFAEGVTLAIATYRTCSATHQRLQH